MGKNDRVQVIDTEIGADDEKPEPEPAAEARRNVIYKDATYSVDIDADGWPAAAGLAFSRALNAPSESHALAHVGDFLEAVMLPGDWLTFQRTARTRDLNGLFNAVMTQAFAATPGESDASSD